MTTKFDGVDGALADLRVRRQVRDIELVTETIALTYVNLALPKLRTGTRHLRSRPPTARRIRARLEAGASPRSITCGPGRPDDAAACGRCPSEECDAIVLPTLPIVAPLLGEQNIALTATATRMRGRDAPAHAAFHLTGHRDLAALRTPGLPVGLQLVGKPDRRPDCWPSPPPSRRSSRRPTDVPAAGSILTRMAVRHVSVAEAHELQQQGSIYLDVRSTWEFLDGHPAGAMNVPLLEPDEQTGQMLPNPDFMRVVQANLRQDGAADRMSDGGRSCERPDAVGLLRGRQHAGRLRRRARSERRTIDRDGPSQGSRWKRRRRRARRMTTCSRRRIASRVIARFFHNWEHQLATVDTNLRPSLRVGLDWLGFPSDPSQERVIDGRGDRRG